MKQMRLVLRNRESFLLAKEELNMYLGEVRLILRYDAEIKVGTFKAETIEEVYDRARSIALTYSEKHQINIPKIEMTKDYPVKRIDKKGNHYFQLMYGDWDGWFECEYWEAK